MDNATNYDSDSFDSKNWDLDDWMEMSNADDEPSKINRRQKKRRKPLRKNRKPSRPANYIGQRSNNHLLRIFDDQ
ncbi:MAG: hypothetical protein AAGD11_15225 [Planctomycetota bacterium]